MEMKRSRTQAGNRPRRWWTALLAVLTLGAPIAWAAPAKPAAKPTGNPYVRSARALLTSKGARLGVVKHDSLMRKLGQFTAMRRASKGFMAPPSAALAQKLRRETNAKNAPFAASVGRFAKVASLTASAGEQAGRRKLIKASGGKTPQRAK